MLLKKILAALTGASGVGFAALLFSTALSAVLSTAIGPFAFMIIPPALLCALVWGGLTGWRRADPRNEYTLLQCSECGYSIRGSSGDTCPECGYPLDDERKHYRNTWLYGPDADFTKTHES